MRQVSSLAMYVIAFFSFLDAKSQVFHPSGTTGIGTTTNPSTNNVGIGISTPQESLHVHNGMIRVTGANHSGGPMIQFGGNPVNDYGEWGIEYAPSLSQSGLKGLNFWKPWPVNNWGNYFMFLADNGQIGINTDNPDAKLHIKNTSSSLATLRLDADAGDYTYGFLYKYTGSDNWHKAFAINNNAGKDVFVVNSNGYTVIGDVGSCSTALPGYSGPNPSYKLVVEKGIITEKIKVAVACSNDWSDYVFDDNYKLKPLEEVAAFIRENKHLPDIPAAEEMVNNGNNLGQTDALLLKKIEELWLHIIALQEQVKTLQNEKRQ